jgi:hypothetical protein
VIVPQLAVKTLDSGAGPETFAHTPTKPARRRGSRSPKLLGVLV